MMNRVLTGAEAKNADTYTIEKIGIASAVLMERAAIALAERVKTVLPANGKGAVLCVCGCGNNGGDGVAAARLLLMNGIRAEVFLSGNTEHMSQGCKTQLNIFRNLGGNRLTEKPAMGSYCVIVDALLGTGLSRNIDGEKSRLVDEINESGAYVIAADLPSGISADSGQVLGNAVRADETVTFSYLKRGLLLYPGREYCGRILIGDAGIVLPPAKEEVCLTMDDSAASLLLPKRRRRSNKGTYGKALLVCGKKGMAGAAVLAGRGALKSGAGLVMNITAPENRDIMQMSLPEALFLAAGEESARDKIMTWPTAIGCGCGLGTEETAKMLLDTVLASNCGKIVLDADALNVIAEAGHFPETGEKQVVITPHPGEMSRLTRKSIGEILCDPVSAAQQYALENHVIVVLKDAATVVTDGFKIYINQSGCSGMSTGGSGDVLTGLVTGLLAQGMDAFEAAALGVYIHGLAGEYAQKTKGEYSMTAADIAEETGKAFLKLTGEV